MSDVVPLEFLIGPFARASCERRFHFFETQKIGFIASPGAAGEWGH
jgi:hypothetical protein